MVPGVASYGMYLASRWWLPYIYTAKTWLIHTVSR